MDENDSYRPVEPSREAWETRSAAELDAIDFEEPGWLIQGLWPGDAYGVLAAEAKAGKTWMGLDLLVSVTTATPFLGHFDTGAPGPAIIYCGEGAERSLQRRLRAVCAERGVQMPQPLHYACFAPDLTDDHHLDQIASDIRRIRPRLLVLDPLYLSMGGKNMASLTEVGPVLRGIQTVCEATGCALVIVHHFNQTGHGSSARRMSGAGPEEWGRVLFSVTVTSEGLDPETGGTVARLSVEVKGSEVPSTCFEFTRKVWTDDPNSLTAAMHFEIDCSEPGSIPTTARVGLEGKVLELLRSRPGEQFSVKAIMEELAADTTSKQEVRKYQRACKSLLDAGDVDGDGGTGRRAGLYWCTDSNAQSA